MPHFARSGALLMAAAAAWMVTELSAAEAASSVRRQLGERLRSEFQYQPKPHDANGGAVDDEPVVQLEPFVVTGQRDKSEQVARIFRERHQQELARRPSVEGGASIDRRGVTIGPRPYRDLFKDDARFKTDQAITPTWNLFRVGPRE
jgi:hypothetical protein